VTTPLIDWSRLGRRMAVVALGWVLVIALGAAVTAALAGLTRGALLLWLGLGAVGLVASAITLIAASAVGGMVRAGDRGQRLSSDDVGLSPPQVRRRARRGEER
jgi:hypothetical protein